MSTTPDPENAEFLKTHSLYVAPEGDLIPVVVTKHQHPLTAVRIGNPVFDIYIHPAVAKTILTFLLEKAEEENHSYIQWCLTGEIYLPISHITCG